MKFYQIQQNTDIWKDLRSKKFTASTFKNLMASKTTAAYNNEIYRVVYEIITSKSPDNFESKWMDRGHELESLARKKYEMETFNDVQDGGFFEMNEFIGCSPDGLIDDDGLLEIKCPKYSTMIQYMLDHKLPNEYRYQVYGQLLVTGRKWCDFTVYDTNLKLFILRVYPDQKIFDELVKELQTAIIKVKEILKVLKYDPEILVK